jgi:PhnB protein
MSFGATPGLTGMSIKHVIPYIHLNGTAAKAIAHYQQALGATVVGEVMRYSQMPGGDTPAEIANLVMHCVLEVGPELLMISDATPEHAVPDRANLSILLEFDSPDELQRAFDALGKGGTVEMPVHDAFWGAKFGVLVDAFGVRWNFHAGQMSA